MRKATLIGWAFRLAVLAAPTSALLLLGCSDFEEPNVDPHAPAISNFQVLTPVIGPGCEVWISFDYVDLGADIDNFTLKDEESKTQGSGIPPEKADEKFILFPGIRGRYCGAAGEWKVGQAGVHRLQLWLKDFQGSESDIHTGSFVFDLAAPCDLPLSKKIVDGKAKSPCGGG